MLSSIVSLVSSPKKKVKIQVDFQPPYALLGADLSGTISIKCSEPILIGSIRAEIVGVGSFNVTRPGDENGGLNLRGTREYMRSGQFFVVDCRPTGGISVSGVESVPFAIRIPYGDYPSSHHFRLGNRRYFSKMKYSCTFTVLDMNDAFLCSELFKFIAQSHHNYDKPELPMYDNVRVVLPGCLCFFEAMSGVVHLTTDKSVYFPGEHVSVTCWADELSEGAPGFSVFLFLCRHSIISGYDWNFLIGSFPTSHSVSMALSKSVLVLTDGELHKASLLIPPTAPATFPGIPGHGCAFHYGIFGAVCRVSAARGNVKQPASDDGDFMFTPPHRAALPIVVNSRPSTVPMVFPTRPLPSGIQEAQTRYAQVCATAGQPAAAAAAAAAVASVEGVEMEVSASYVSPSSYQPVMMSDEMKR